MQFFGDYHTHTKWSDGKSTIEDNIQGAIQRGLQEVAISEHGLRNLAYSRKKFLAEYEYIQSIKSNYPINILYGNEADFIDEYGNLDITQEDIAKLDVLTVGFHQFAVVKSFRDWKRTYMHSVLHSLYSKNSVYRKQNTQILIRCIEKYDIDILAHPNHLFFIDPKEIAKACVDNGTYMEINVKHIDIAEGIIDQLLSTDVGLIVNSDAHRACDVGKFDNAIQMIEKYGLEHRIVNLSNKAPQFHNHKK